jgi:membrane protein
MMGYLKKAKAFLVEGLWTVPLESLSGPQAFLVRLLRLITVSFKDFSEGLISLRAMSLVYTTLLSLVPLLAVSFSVLKGFGVHNQIEPVLANFLAPLGPKGQELTTKIIGFVENLNVGVLGSLGLAFLLYTVISLVQKIEGAFNEIWHVRRSRSFSRRISDYLSLILVGPVLVFSGLGLAASITGTALVKKVLEVEAVGTALLMAGKLVPFLVVCAAFSFIYLFIPSTKVHLKSALVGGGMAGVLWQTAGIGFASFLVTSTRYAAIYSGFAILILFMIWIYLSWLILLFGAKVAFYHQYPHFLNVRKEDILLSNRLEEKLALAIMYLVGVSHYRNEKRWDLDSLLDHLKLPLEPVQNVIERLEKRGLVLAGCDEPPGLLPARDIETILLSEVVGAVRCVDGCSSVVEDKLLSLPAVDEVSRSMDEAIGGALGGRTVKDLVLEGTVGD